MKTESKSARIDTRVSAEQKEMIEREAPNKRLRAAAAHRQQVTNR